MHNSPFLKDNSNKKRVKSVLNSSAQSTTLCAPGTDPDQLLYREVQRIIADTNFHISFRALVELMFTNALRISEALQITVYDIDTTGRIIIKAKKGSSNKVVVSSSFNQYFIDCKLSNLSPFIYYDRFSVYRLFRKCGLYLQFSNSKRTAVTHSLRFASISLLNSDNLTLQEKANFVGHKNSSMTKYYGEKERKR